MSKHSRLLGHIVLKFLLKTVIYCDFLLKCNILYMSADVLSSLKMSLKVMKNSIFTKNNKVLSAIRF